MNGPDQRIEIFKPFGEAFDLMKRILFQPFNIAKWFVIGFAAFLANLSGGQHFNFNFSPNWKRGDWRPFEYKDWQSSVDQLPGWLLDPMVIATGVTVFVAVALVLFWLSARGRFIFTDCIVKNRGAIVEPWREFRKEANSFFLFTLLVGLMFLLIAVLLAFVAVLWALPELKGFGKYLPIMSFVFVGLIIFLLALAWVVIAHFMLPVMYRRRCRAAAAFSAVTGLFAKYPGEFVLYCLFLIVLVIGTTIVGCAVTCATCCIAAIPYIGTVILLPIFVLLRGFSFCFLRQFGPDYDVWQVITPPEPPPILPAPESVIPPPPQA